MSAANPLFTSLTAPSPHPDTEALRQYAAGTLTPADEQRIEAHTLDCERCADILEGLSMSDTATTDHAVAELRARLQTRIGQGERGASGTSKSVAALVPAGCGSGRSRLGSGQLLGLGAAGSSPTLGG